MARLPSEARAWRCEACGKWSHALRRPASHSRWQPIHEDGELVGHERVVCGPFLEWDCVRVDGEGTRPQPSRFGERLEMREIYEDPNEGIEGPF